MVDKRYRLRQQQHQEQSNSTTGIAGDNSGTTITTITTDSKGNETVEEFHSEILDEDDAFIDHVLKLNIDDDTDVDIVVNIGGNIKGGGDRPRNGNDNKRIEDMGPNDKHSKSIMSSVSMESKSNSPSAKRQPRRTSEHVVGKTRWLSLKTLDWTDEDGVNRKWDIASRNTKQAHVPDAVVIIPLLRTDASIDTLLVKQYRPPIEAYTLEFPAGLIDEGETAQIAGIRELFEETGYVGTVDHDFSLADELCMSPGLCDETIQIVVLNIDMDDPRNINPKQHMDEGESITVHRVPLSVGLKDVLASSSQATSTSSPSPIESNSSLMPIALLQSFAIGLEMGAKYCNM
jgi:8-oxo-dGTP pyrophosphatase MutT (NUDIX family)